MLQMVFGQTPKSCRQKYSKKIEMLIKKFQNKLILKMKNFLFIKKDYAEIEKQNNISIDIFRYKYKGLYRIYTSKQTCEKHAHFVLLLNS